MAHFYGTAQGNRGEATKGGSKDSGMETYCASWEGAIRCSAWYDEDEEKDMVRVEKVRWKGAGQNRLLYEGPIGSARRKYKPRVKKERPVEVRQSIPKPKYADFWKGGY